METENGKKFERKTNKVLAIVFAAMRLFDIIGVIAENAYWHIPTILMTGSLSVALWVSDEGNNRE